MIIIVVVIVVATIVVGGIGVSVTVVLVVCWWCLVRRKVAVRVVGEGIRAMICRGLSGIAEILRNFRRGAGNIGV